MGRGPRRANKPSEGVSLPLVFCTTLLFVDYTLRVQWLFGYDYRREPLSVFH